MELIHELITRAHVHFTLGDFHQAVRCCYDASNAMQKRTANLEIQTSMDKHIALLFEVLCVMQMAESKQSLCKDFINDFQRLTRLSNPPKIEVARGYK